MTKDTYEQAKFIQDKLSHFRVKKTQIEQMKKRDEDKDFTIARELAHDGICYAISRLEADFNAL